MEELRSKQAFLQERREIQNLINKSKVTLNPQIPQSELFQNNQEEEKQPRPPAPKRRKIKEDVPPAS